jgi:hypothetical protein
LDDELRKQIFGCKTKVEDAASKLMFSPPKDLVLFPSKSWSEFSNIASAYKPNSW